MLNVQDIFKQPYFMPHWERAGCFFLMPKAACTFYQSIPVCAISALARPNMKTACQIPANLAEQIGADQRFERVVADFAFIVFVFHTDFRCE